MGSILIWGMVSQKRRGTPSTGAGNVSLHVKRKIKTPLLPESPPGVDPPQDQCDTFAQISRSLYLG